MRTRTRPSPNSAAWGVLRSYASASGEPRRVRTAAVDAVLAALGADSLKPAGDRAPLTVLPGERPVIGRATITTEDGAAVEVLDRLPPDLPAGYHRVVTGDADRMLIVSPGSCYSHRAESAFGVAVQLYAARSRRSAAVGAGDLTDLATITAYVADRGGSVVLINPLGLGHTPSPYFPSSRIWLDPLYLDTGRLVDSSPKAADAPATRSPSGPIDRERALANKLAQLRSSDRQDSDSRVVEDCAAWALGQGDSLSDFARFTALAERHGTDWRKWPDELRTPAGARRVIDADPELTRSAAFATQVQFHLHGQLASAAPESVAVIHDLPVGVDPGGADAWAYQGSFSTGASVGAPPDEFNQDGQDWALPPFDPWQLRVNEYRPFIETIRAALQRGQGLRIDHVMGLFRLWWIPHGSDPADGAYVRYPARDLLAILAIESRRARSFVVGEDLGTVSGTIRRSLRGAGVMGCAVLWFEDDPPASWPARSLASVTTHDLPTVAGMWNRSDVAAQHRIGLRPNLESTERIRSSLAHRCELPASATTEDAIVAAHSLLASARSRIRLATLDDMTGTEQRPNMPGTVDEWPNWRIPLPVFVEDLPNHALAERVMAALRGG